MVNTNHCVTNKNNYFKEQLRKLCILTGLWMSIHLSVEDSTNWPLINSFVFDFQKKGNINLMSIKTKQGTWQVHNDCVLYIGEVFLLKIVLNFSTKMLCNGNTKCFFVKEYPKKILYEGLGLRCFQYLHHHRKICSMLSPVEPSIWLNKN